MKLIEKIPNFCWAFIIIGSLFGFANGCATRELISPALPAQAALTNTVTGAVTPAVAAVPAIYTNVPNATAIQAGALAQEAAPYLPAPWNEAAAGLGVILTGIATFIAARKNGQANSAAAVTTAIIQGVEAAGSAAAPIKASIATVSKANGVSDAVEAAVNKVVGSA